MKHPPHQRRRWIPWQTSLRALLLVAIGTGTLAGLFGEDLVRVVREYFSPPPPPRIQVPSNARIYNDKSDGYFESAETPLH